MAETAAQRRKRLADELERLEAEGHEGAAKLRESLDHLDKREAAKRGEDPETERRPDVPTTTIKVQEHRTQTPPQTVKSLWPGHEVRGA